MARDYYCEACQYKKSTDKIRGPVPRLCPECKADPFRKPVTLVRRPDARSIQAQERVHQAIELRKEYWTWSDIAQELGYPSREAAYQAARTEMTKRAEQLAETIDDFRDREMARLESMAAVALEILKKDHVLVNAGRIVMTGPEGQERPLLDDGPTLAAIDRLVKISESARKLLGADAATKTDAQVNVNYTVEGIAEMEMP